MTLRIVLASSFVLGALAAAHGCKSPTEIKAVMSLDFDCAKQQGSSVTVGALGAIEARPVTATSTRCDVGTKSLGDLVLVPSGDRDGDVALKVVVGITAPAESC